MTMRILGLVMAGVFLTGGMVSRVSYF